MIKQQDILPNGNMVVFRTLQVAYTVGQVEVNTESWARREHRAKDKLLTGSNSGP